MLSAWRTQAATVVALLLAACSSSDPQVSTSEGNDTCAADATIHTKVHGGSARASKLSMSTGQTLAIVAVVVNQGESICTGVLVSPNVVLTAAHCVVAGAGGELSVVLGNTIRTPLVELSVIATETHPELDAAALRVSVPECARAEPIPLAPEELDDTWLGKAAEIAGFGWTAPDSVGAGDLLFAAETIVDLEPDHLVVASSSMTSGACGGDSGGPALALVGDEVVLLGTLDDGHPRCMGQDFYVRADRIATWLCDVQETWGL